MKHSIINRTSLFTLVAGVVLALTGLAQAGTVGESASKKAGKTKTGLLNIEAATSVGGVLLEPGEYGVKQVNSANGPVVRITRYTYNPYTQEGLSVYDSETVAEVKVTLQPLASKAARTQLVVDSQGHKPIALEIRGNSFDYLFASA